jgi:regulator of RNase E activity RraA
MDLVERLAAIPYSGAISDILDDMGLRNQVLPSAIQALQPGQTVAGRALTVSGEPAPERPRDEYFLPLLNMLGSIQPGDVVVSQPSDSLVAHFGELCCETARFRGGRGAVIDGGARDLAYANKLSFPVFARYRTPQDIVGRWRMTGCNAPITIGAVVIHPGDYVLGDLDGVVVIPKMVAEDVVTRAEALVHTEDLVRKAILEGVHPVKAYETYGRF